MNGNEGKLNYCRIQRTMEAERTSFVCLLKLFEEVGSIERVRTILKGLHTVNILNVYSRNQRLASY